MKKIFVTILMLLSVIGTYGQEVVRLDAECCLSFLGGKTKSQLSEYMRGSVHEEIDEYSDIYYIYSSREGKNIPLQFFYTEKEDGELHVWKVEFISRKSRYRTADLNTAFWIEYIKDSKRKSNNGA